LYDRRRCCCSRWKWNFFKSLFSRSRTRNMPKRSTETATQVFTEVLMADCWNILASLGGKKVLHFEAGQPAMRG
jgi:hypothetical protein